MFRKTIATLATGLAALMMTGVAHARDQIQIVGSSTVYPFATVVAEKHGQRGSMKTPVIESTGTGGGMKLFCAGLGPSPRFYKCFPRNQRQRKRIVCKEQCNLSP